MRKNELIKKLQAIKGNLEVVVDHDENGWFDLEAVGIVEDEINKEKFIDLSSSAKM